MVPWFERREAVVALAGFRSPESREAAAEHAALYEEARRALLARPPFELEPPELEPLPAEIAGRAEEVLGRLRGGDATNGGARVLQVGLIDLRRVVAFQKAVATDSIAERVGGAEAGDWEALAAICLPEPSTAEDLRGTYDKDQKGLTLTSFNPNLRVSGVTQVGRGDDGGPVVAFHVLFGAPEMHVVGYGGRCFLKNGYHRAFGLLDRGVNVVPCVFEAADSFTTVHRGGSAMVGSEYLLGTHPPLLPDFLDPSVSATVSQQSFQKVVRIRAEDFVVHI